MNTEQTPESGEVFTVIVAGAEFGPESIERINAVLGAAIVSELAGKHFAGPMVVTPVTDGVTATGQSIAAWTEFDDFCGTNWPGKFRRKIGGPGIGGPGGDRGPIINGIILDRFSAIRR